MAHGAGLILRGLIVGRSCGSLSGKLWHCRQSMFTRLTRRKRGLVEPCGRVATDAALGLDRHVLIDERALLVDVALVADGIAVGQGPELPGDRRPMRVMAVVALQQALVHAVVIGFGEVRFGRRCGSRSITAACSGPASAAFLWRDAASDSRGSRRCCWSGRIRKNGPARALRRGKLRQRALVSCRE